MQWLICSMAFTMAFFDPERAFSQEIQEIETDRPDQTECSSVLPPRTIQLETGIVQELDNDDRTLLFPTTLIRIGAYKTVEFRIIAGEYFISKIKTDSIKYKQKGFSPISFGTKIFITKERRYIPQTALLFHLNHESTKFLFQSIYWDFRFSMSHTLSDRWSAGYNLGGEWNKNENLYTWIYTLTAAYSLSQKTGAFIEVFGDVRKHHFPNHQFDFGLTYLIRKNMLLDCSSGIALIENATDQFFNMGFSWRIPN